MVNLRQMRRVMPRVSVLLMTAATSSCCFGTELCTLIGCEDGIRISLTEIPTLDVSMEVIADDGVQENFQCSALEVCSVLLEDRFPENVTIRVTHGSDVTSIAVRPEYNTSRPNGRCCPSECRSASVDIDIPT